MNSPILPGENHAYPEGDWPAREQIIRRHLEFGLGDGGTPLSAEAFARLLPAAAMAKGTEPQAAVTRGTALQWMWELLRGSPTSGAKEGNPLGNAKRKLYV
jgi:hypothetical protein